MQKKLFSEILKFEVDLNDFGGICVNNNIKSNNISVPKANSTACSQYWRVEAERGFYLMNIYFYKGEKQFNYRSYIQFNDNKFVGKKN